MVGTTRLAAALLSLALTHPVSAEGAMTLDFTWAGYRGCTGAGSNPAFAVQNAPAGTRRLLFTLHNGSFEMGGDSVAFADGGRVAANRITHTGPCNPAFYEWRVSALDGLGRVVATASRIRAYPSR